MNQQFQNNVQQDKETSAEQAKPKKLKGFWKLFFIFLAINIIVYIIIVVFMTFVHENDIRGIVDIAIFLLVVPLLSINVAPLVVLPVFLLSPCIPAGVIVISRKMKNKIARIIFRIILLFIYYVAYSCVPAFFSSIAILLIEMP